MSYNIPTGSGQIRLGYDFNRCFYHGGSNSAQLNFNNDRIRNTSKTNLSSTDTPYASGAQKNLSAYRGTTGCWGYLGTGTSSTVAGDQAYLQEVEAGGHYIWGSVAARVRFNISGYGNVDYQYADNGDYNSGTSNGNAAANIVAYLGYLEPGSYKVYANWRQYNAGYSYLIVRGYTSGYLSGSSSNYKYQANYHFSGTFDNFYYGGGSFTVNSTYPYVILDIECHNDNDYYNQNYILRKESSLSTYNANPCVVRQ